MLGGPSGGLGSGSASLGLSFLPVKRGGRALLARVRGPPGVGVRRKGGEGGWWPGGAAQERPSPSGAHKRAMCPPWAARGGPRVRSRDGDLASE